MEDKKPKKVMTDKQKAARNANLVKARQKRKESLKEKHESKEQEYDLTDSELSSDSDSDNDAFVISRKKKFVPKEVVMKSQRVVKKTDDHENNLKKDFDELKCMVEELANMQKKQAVRKKNKRSSGGTKIVLLPQTSSQGSGRNSIDNSVMEQLRKSLM